MLDLEKILFGYIIFLLLYFCFIVYKGLLEKVCCDLKLFNLCKLYVRLEKFFRINFFFIFRFY